MKTEPQAPAIVLEKIRAAREVLICTHMEPDGDCIASSMALASALTRTGKEVHQFNPGPFDRGEIQRFQSHFLPSVPSHLRRHTAGRLVVVLDCALPERIGSLADEIMGLPAVVIDHHPVETPMGDAAWVVPEAPAAAWLVQLVIEALDVHLSAEEARLLMFGLCTDTGYFRHLNETHAPVFTGVSRIVAAGASPREAHAAMYGNRTMESRKLIATLLQRMQSHFGGRFLITWELEEDTRTVGKSNRDSETFYQLAFAVREVEALALIREESPGRCTGSLRSRDSIDVSPVARKYGGGGHKNASGFLAELDYKDLVANLLHDFGVLFGS